MANLVLAPARQQQLTERTPAQIAPHLTTSGRGTIFVSYGSRDEESSTNFSPWRSRASLSLKIHYPPPRQASPQKASRLHGRASGLLPLAGLLSFSSKSLPSRPQAVPHRDLDAEVGRTSSIHQVGNTE